MTTTKQRKLNLDTPTKLAKHLIAKLEDCTTGFTIDARTGQAPKLGYWAVGGMIQPYGELGALYYSPTGTPDLERLEAVIEANWEAIQIYGHVGAWVVNSELGREAFIDVTYLVPCGIDTEAGHSEASEQFASKLGQYNNQLEICHVCTTGTECKGQ